MPILRKAWRELVQLVRGGQAPQSSADRMQGLYRRVREHALETFRNSELGGFEDMHRERRAKRRSLSLLMRLLSPQQRQEFRQFGHFHVAGGASGNRYRIRPGTFANIDVLYASGRVKHRLCAHPAGDVPVYDVMAAQMLHLQDPLSEPRFLRQANVHLAISEDSGRSASMWMG